MVFRNMKKLQIIRRQKHPNYAAVVGPLRPRASTFGPQSSTFYSAAKHVLAEFLVQTIIPRQRDGPTHAVSTDK